MKPWQSVSARLTVTLLTVTLGSLVGLFLILNAALMRFFVQDAQANLIRQAVALATHTQAHWQNAPQVHQLANLSSQQGQVQVMVLDQTGKARVICRGGPNLEVLPLPPAVIAQTFAGTSQTGQFQGANSAFWLYSTAPIRSAAGNQIVGAVSVAMPLRRPQQFADQVGKLVMGVAIAATTLAAVAGWGISRSLTNPLRALRQQTQRLEAGDYTARSALKGADEFAQLSRLLDRMAAKLAQTLAALQAQETARRELVANVSHDLRTPLASLRVGLEAILDGIVTGDQVQIYLQRACREIDYLSNLVEQLLLLSKADAGQLSTQPQAVSAIAIAQECLARMQAFAAQADLALELVTVPDLPLVWVDPALTGQAILNVIDNAIKYAADGKVVRLQALAPVEHDRQHFVPLQVKDYGCGMDAEMVQQATQRFYRGDHSRPRGGMGLGLAIAQQVCQLQHGHLQIESVSGQGTVITFLLPVADGFSAARHLGHLESQPVRVKR